MVPPLGLHLMCGDILNLTDTTKTHREYHSGRCRNGRCRVAKGVGFIADSFAIPFPVVISNRNNYVYMFSIIVCCVRRI